MRSLYVDSGNWRGFAPIIIAELGCVELEVKEVVCDIETNSVFLEDEDKKTHDVPFSALSKNGVLPVYVENSGVTTRSLTDMHTICRYLARIGKNSSLLGGDCPWTMSQVDDWLAWAALRLERPIHAWIQPLLGESETLKAELEIARHRRARLFVARALRELETRLSHAGVKNVEGGAGSMDGGVWSDGIVGPVRQYLVGEKLTIADIVVCSALIYLFRFAAGPVFYNNFPHVKNWFSEIVNIPEVISVVGPHEWSESEPEIASFVAVHRDVCILHKDVSSDLPENWEEEEESIPVESSEEA